MEVFALLSILLYLCYLFLCEYWNYANGESSKGNPNLPDIDTAIVNLISVAMRADGHPSKPELLVVKSFLLRGFGETRARSMLLKLRDVLKSNPVTDIRRDCVKVNQSLNYRQKLALLNLFLAIASTGRHPLKLQVVQFITLFVRYVRIATDDFAMLRGSYFSETEWYHASNGDNPNRETRTKPTVEDAYKVLGIPANSDMSQVKRAYRSLVKQWHPDRFESKSDAEKEYAETMFRKVDEAYKKILENS